MRFFKVCSEFIFFPFIIFQNTNINTSQYINLLLKGSCFQIVTIANKDIVNIPECFFDGHKYSFLIQIGKC